jgi:transcription elongation GreA/GreB family factor
MDSTITSKPLPEIEEWFLGRVEETPLQASDLLAVLKAVGAESGNRTAAESWSELLFERLKKDRDTLNGVDWVALRAGWMAGRPEPEIRAACDRWLTDLFSRETIGRNFVPGAGFRDTVSVTQCFRRLRLLMSLKPGAFCVHKSWGPGAIKRLDDFYSKVVIDFTGHPNHEMGYAFVAESLELPGDDHLLAIRFRQPEKLKAMVREQPAEVVRITLRSFGSMPMARLQQTLCPAVLPTADWKTFWDAARRGLVAEGDCEIPAKKLEPLRLIDRAATPACRWTARMRDERRLDTLTVMFEELLQDRDRPKNDAAFDQLVREKMGSVIYGAAGSKEELVVRTMLVAHQMAMQLPGANLDAMRDRWMREPTFKNLLNDLPVRLVQPFIEMVTANLTDGLPFLLKLIPILNLSPMSEAIDLLLEHDKGEMLQERLRQVAYGRKENILFLCWMARNLDKVKAWSLVPLEELPFRIIEMLRGVFMYENLRAANALKLMLNDRDWLQRTVGSMDEIRRADFLRLVREPDAPMYYDAQALLGRLIVLFPELAAAFESDVTKPARPTSGLTSWRSYTHRQRQFERLLNIEIPKNARDIEIARSYGDLRENHEYKTAKEMQGILLHRKDEMHRELQTVRGTDFEGFSTETAGMGVQVDVDYPDGSRSTYTILGEWDQDPALHIISCQSGLGKRLEGLKLGDAVGIPDGEGNDREARVAAVRPLPPEVKEWVRNMTAP